MEIGRSLVVVEGFDRFLIWRRRKRVNNRTISHASQMNSVAKGGFFCCCLAAYITRDLNTS